MPVKEVKTTLGSIRFTSDHGVLHWNMPYDDKKPGLRAGAEYKKEKPEWDRESKRNVPVSQTRHTATVESKVKLTLKFSVAGDLGGKEVEIEGDSPENALKFKSAKFNLPANGGEVEQTLTATNNIGSDLRIVDAEINWK